ncbi:cell wall-binding repeat-containing protein [Herbiconiux liukaitaii]|uniref:cell wall-binding repeat-containing protein n=1 Tax=Herbiconiux liukaitaii TaxID=3342799 RepID=UPI0035B89F34
MKPRLVSAAAVCVVALLTVGLAQGAAAAPRDFELARLASVAPSASGDGIGDIAIDSTTQRAFVLDQRNKAVHVYDISGDAFVPVATISGALDFPVAAAVNETTHTLYVADGGRADAIVAIDVDPASPTANKVVRTVASGGDGVGAIAVDPARNTVYVTNRSTHTVSVLDAAGTTTPRLIATGDEPQDVEVDPRTGKAYVSSSEDSSLTVVSPDGSSTNWPLDNRPFRLVVVGDELIATSDRPYAAHLDKYDLQTGQRVASSPPLGAMPFGLAADPALRAIYIGSAAGGVAGVRALRSTDLVLEGGGSEDYFNSVVVDPVTHRLLVGETPRFGRPSEVVMFDPQPRPLASVDRIGGADRFEVSAGVAADTFDSGGPVAYVASGGGFADALSGSAAAGAQGGPVLLVSKDSVPGAVAARLKSLRPQRIVVLGGTASVSAAVEKQLSAYSPSVTRLAGADRYGVSAGVSAAAFPEGADVAYLASGAVFSDALSGSAAAGRESGPVLLTRKDGVPAEVLDELRRLKPKVVMVLGGLATVDESVVTALQQSWPVIRVDGADRYAVSAAISARTFSDGAYTVYLASGAVFPDALSGSAAAIAEDSPVLLVTKDAIPAPVAAELDRLDPYRVVVLGGPSTVSEQVETQLETYLPR